MPDYTGFRDFEKNVLKASKIHLNSFDYFSHTLTFDFCSNNSITTVITVIITLLVYIMLYKLNNSLTIFYPMLNYDLT